MRALSEVTSRLLAPIQVDIDERLEIALTKEGDEFLLTAFCADRDGTRSSARWSNAQRFFSRIPERDEVTHFGAGIRFKCGATDTTATLINKLWPKNQLLFEAEDAKITYDYLVASTARQEEAADVYANFKDQGAVPAHDLEMHWDLPLASYQQVALYNSSRSEGFGLFMEQGTGKTPVVIARIMNEARKVREKEGRPYRAIIVAPKNVRMNWESEIHKFATEAGKVTVLRGVNALYRMNELLDAMRVDEDDMYTIVICSYEAIKGSWDHGLKLIEWDLAVADEGHYIKTVKAQRTKYAWKLRDRSRQRMLLTGTPITNTPLDLYAQLEFLGKGYSGFTSWSKFKQFYGVYETNESGHRALVALQNMPFMQERLARYAFIVRKEEALPNLPAKVYDVVEVDMAGRQLDVYNSLRDTLYAEIELMISSAEAQGTSQLVVNNVLTRLLRLAQITSGFAVAPAVKDDDGNTIVEKQVECFDPNPKIDALVELLKEKGPNDKTIVWACWTEDLAAIKAACDKAGIGAVLFYGATSDKVRDEAVHKFNHDFDTKVFIGNPAAGGTGLNLLGYPPGQEDVETNANHVVYFSQGWSSPIRSQSEDRCHRRGTREPVRITDLCVPATIDEEIRARVLSKITRALEISDIRHILENVLKGGLLK